MRKIILSLFVMSHVAFGKVTKVEGIASWYGEPFHGRRTFSGEVYDMHAMTAASNRFPMGTIVKVTNKSNDKHVVVKINDTGAFSKKYGREIDLSRAAFAKLDKLGRGLLEVEVEVIKKAEKR
ncbi:MAG: septal ring lytic transglycosylase RlpA family protein [Bacteroidales bacterium]